jgi:hemerythrin superfamily protein
LLPKDTMDAIDLLELQHREADSLFDRIAAAVGRARKRELFERLADSLAIHSALEEMHFYPSVKAPSTEKLLHQSLEEHLSVKRLLADLLAISPDDEQFDAKIEVLAAQVRRHVDEERGDLFPKVRRLLDADQREAIGQLMTATMVELEKGHPRFDVPLQTLAAPPLQGYTGDTGGNLMSRVFPRVARLIAAPVGFLRRLAFLLAGAGQVRKRREV